MLRVMSTLVGPGRPEGLPQLRDQFLKVVASLDRSFLAPEVVDEFVCRHDPPGVEEQRGEKGSLFDPT